MEGLEMDDEEEEEEGQEEEQEILETARRYVSSVLSYCSLVSQWVIWILKGM